jgi:hypothetical protein
VLYSASLGLGLGRFCRRRRVSASTASAICPKVSNRQSKIGSPRFPIKAPVLSIQTDLFEYMLSAVQREFGVGPGQVLQTAQSQFHDHQPAIPLLCFNSISHLPQSLKPPIKDRVPSIPHQSPSPHDHQPARKVGIKSVWIERTGALMGNRGDPIFDWRFGQYTIRMCVDHMFRSTKYLTLLILLTYKLITPPSRG